MRNISDKICKETQYTYFMLNKLFFENRAVYEKMWNNTVEWGRPQMTIRRMNIQCWLLKARNTNTEYVILIAFPLQQ